MKRTLAALAPAVLCLLSDRLGAAFPLVLAFAVALLIVAFPPHRSDPPWLEWIWIALALVPLLGFLPLDPSAMPEWRVALARHPGVDLGGMITPQPYVLFASIIPFWSGLAYLWWACGQRWDSLEAIVLTRAFLVLLAAIASVVILWKMSGHPSLPGILSGNNSALMTRNQLATALAAGVALGTAVLFSRPGFRPVAAGFGAASALLCAAALAMLGSRGGWLAAGLGLAVVLAVIAALRRSMRHAITAIVLLAAGFAAIAILPGETGGRLRQSIAGGWRGDVRLAIQHDATALAAEHPWTGYGLGNFDSVFPFYRNRSQGAFRAVHPESDLLWFAGEAGLLAAALALATVAGMGRGWWNLARADAGRMEPAAAASGATAVLVAHGLLDVPAHSPLVWFVVAGIAGAAFGSNSLPVRPRSAPALAVALALAACAIAAAIILRTDRPRPFANDTPLDQIPDATAIDRWLAQRPLDWQIVELRAHRSAADGRIEDARKQFFLLERLTPFEAATIERALHAWVRAGQPREFAAAAMRFLARVPKDARPSRLPTITDRARRSPAVAREFARLDPPLAWEIRGLEIPAPVRARTLACLAIAIAGHGDFDDACGIALFQLAPDLGETPASPPGIEFPRLRWKKTDFRETRLKHAGRADSWYEVAEMRYLSDDPEGAWRLLQTLLVIKLPIEQP